MSAKPSVPSHYHLLGLEPEASQDEVRAAYRKMAKRFHPDKNPEDPSSEELFKKVADAYRILSDPKARKFYDHSAGVAPVARPPKPPEPKPDPEPEVVVNRNINVRLHLNLEQAYKGGHKEIKINRKIPCAACRSNNGKPVEKECEKCNNTGIVKKLTSVDVVFPAGVRAGSVLKLAAFGHRLPPNNLSGDLLVEIAIKPDKFLEVKEQDLYYHTLIGLDIFIEGGDVHIPLPGGGTTVNIPPRVPDGRILKVPGRGMPQFDKHPTGDLYLKIELCVPKRLSRKERLIINELMSLPGFHPPVDADGFISKGD